MRCRHWLVAAVIGLTACGSKPVGTIDANGTSDVPAEQPGDSAIDAGALVGTALEVVSGQRGEKEDAPGAVRFDNLYAPGGTPTDIDIWWGLPDEGEKAASVAFGQVSDYLTPRRAKGQNDVTFSMTAAGDPNPLMVWDRWTPESAADRITVVWNDDDGSVSMGQLWENPATVDAATGNAQFPLADAGRVRLSWQVYGSAIEVGEALLSVVSGGRCLTNGSFWVGPDGNASYDLTSQQVDPGSELSLATSCDGAPVASVTAPASGRAILIAYRGVGGAPQLQIVPVTEI